MKWKKVKLTEICKPKQWKNLPISELTEVGYPVYGANGIIGKYKEYNHEHPTLAITCRGATCGTINITLPKSYITSNAMALNDLSDEIDQMFLYYALNKRGFKDVITGAAQPQITREGLSKITLDIPESKKDQLHIANILTKAENLINQRKESIRLLDEFLKSTFLEMFGDLKGEKVPLSSACIVNPKKSEINSLDKSMDVSFVPMAFVSEKGEVDLSQIRKLDAVWNGFTYFQENDVVFAKITPCMENGKGAIMRNLKNKIGFGTTEFHVLRPVKETSTAEWIYHLTMQHSFRKKAEQNMTGSAGQKRVPTDYFDKVRVVIPPIALQTQFAHIAEKTEILKTQYQQSLQELENLYGSLSQRAFKGELGVKDDSLLMAAEPEAEYET